MEHNTIGGCDCDLIDNRGDIGHESWERRWCIDFPCVGEAVDTIHPVWIKSALECRNYSISLYLLFSKMGGTGGMWWRKEREEMRALCAAVVRVKS